MTRPTRIVVPKAHEWINANQRLHWSTRAQRTRAWREATAWRARAEGLPCYGDRQVHITCWIHKTRAGRWDATNLAPTGKACIDGLRDAGVLLEDDNAHVVGPDMRAGGKAPMAHMVIQIVEVAP